MKMYTQHILSYVEQQKSVSVAQLGVTYCNLMALEQCGKTDWEDFLAKFSYHGRVCYNKENSKKFIHFS